MSVTTKADQKLQEAKDAMSEAYKALLEVMDEDTWGHHDFHPAFMQLVAETAIELYKLKKKL